jgi:hypothetical protein
MRCIASNIIIKFKPHLPPEWLHSFRCTDWFDRLPSDISCLLNTQSSGFVKLPQPGDYSLPRPGGSAMRFHQRPVSVTLSIFRSVALANKHAREC